MLDKLGKDFDIESDVLQIWKSEWYVVGAFHNYCFVQKYLKT